MKFGLSRTQLLESNLSYPPTSLVLPQVLTFNSVHVKLIIIFYYLTHTPLHLQ